MRGFFKAAVLGGAVLFTCSPAFAFLGSVTYTYVDTSSSAFQLQTGGLPTPVLINGPLSATFQLPTFNAANGQLLDVVVQTVVNGTIQAQVIGITPTVNYNTVIGSTTFNLTSAAGGPTLLTTGTAVADNGGPGFSGTLGGACQLAVCTVGSSPFALSNGATVTGAGLAAYIGDGVATVDLSFASTNIFATGNATGGTLAAFTANPNETAVVSVTYDFYVPEPATVGVFSIGLLGAGLARRRRR